MYSKGAKCSECSAIFTADRGDGKKLIWFSNGGGGTAFHVVCADCGARAQELGLAGLPAVQRDCKLTVLMSPYNPANYPTVVH
jgi:hypothetical protein